MEDNDDGDDDGDKSDLMKGGGLLLLATVNDNNDECNEKKKKLNWKESYSTCCVSFSFDSSSVAIEQLQCPYPVRKLSSLSSLYPEYYQQQKDDVLRKGEEITTLP